MQSTEQLLREALERIIQWDDAGLALTEDLIANAKAAVEQSVKGVEPRISTKHGPWLPSRYHEGETYCQRCLTRSPFSSSRACNPHIVYDAAPSTQAKTDPIAQFCKAVEDIKETSKKLYTEEELRLALEGDRKQFAKRLEQIKEQIKVQCRDIYEEGHIDEANYCHSELKDLKPYKKLLDILNNF